MAGQLVIKIENSRALMMYFSGIKDKERQMEIVYDVFLPDANFRKSNPVIQQSVFV